MDTRIGHSNWIESVSESSDGRFVVCRVFDADTIIWGRESRAIAWKSGRDGNAHITIAKKAESIIRSCGQHTPHTWPRSSPDYSDKIYRYCTKLSVYCNVAGEQILLGNMPSNVHDWKFNDVEKCSLQG